MNTERVTLADDERDRLACRCVSGICPLHNAASDGYLNVEVGHLLATVEDILAARIARGVTR